MQLKPNINQDHREERQTENKKLLKEELNFSVHFKQQNLTESKNGLNSQVE